MIPTARHRAARQSGRGRLMADGGANALHQTTLGKISIPIKGFHG
jgi:hypothetical protein